MGLATARAFAEARASVVLTDLDQQALAVAVAKLQDDGHDVLGVRCDVADEDAERFDRVVSVNLRGIWACMKHELAPMRTQGHGAIVNCSSIGGLIGNPGLASYHATKHGVNGLTSSAALDYAARGVRVNAVCPGTIDTLMVDAMLERGALDMEPLLAVTPMRRLGRPEEVAQAVLWLCSPAASYVTGVALPVDGGYVAQ